MIVREYIDIVFDYLEEIKTNNLELKIFDLEFFIDRLKANITIQMVTFSSMIIYFNDIETIELSFTVTGNNAIIKRLQKSSIF